MLPDFHMINRTFDGKQDIRIYPIADVHLGAAEHMTGEWEQFCQCLLEDPNAYIILGGDLINNATKTSVSNVFEETMRPSEQKKVMAKMLGPLRDRILCAVTGNHERRSEKDVDDDPTYDIMCKLDIEDRYRHDVAFLKVQMGEQYNSNGSRTAGWQRPAYSIVVTHGAGGGMLTGGAVNRFERFGYVLDGCDALIVGHTHKPFVTQPSKIKIDLRNNQVTVAPFKIVCTTSWLNYGGYAVQKMLLPSSHTKQIITLCANKKEMRVEM